LITLKSTPILVTEEAVQPTSEEKNIFLKGDRTEGMEVGVAMSLFEGISNFGPYST
jgi:hypothetical protein